jgi:hypothetical protein
MNAPNSAANPTIRATMPLVMLCLAAACSAGRDYRPLTASEVPAAAAALETLGVPNALRVSSNCPTVANAPSVCYNGTAPLSTPSQASATALLRKIGVTVQSFHCETIPTSSFHPSGVLSCAGVGAARGYQLAITLVSRLTAVESAIEPLRLTLTAVRIEA